MKITAEPRSDQWNADDFIGGPRVFTIAGVKPGSAEQKYDIELVEGEGRVWRPPLTVLRLLLAAWGSDGTAWVGRRVKLYRDESVRFGPDTVGGIRLAAVSDLPGGKPLKVKVTVSRAKRGEVTLQPLTDDDIPATTSKPTPDQLRALGEAFTAAGVTDGPGKAAFINETLARQTRGWDDLSADDVTKVTEALRAVTGDADPWADTAADVAARDEEEAAG